MTLEQRNYLERSMPYLRQSILALGKTGMGTNYYIHHAIEAHKIARRIADKLGSMELQLTIERDF